jgi:hypothetical protein
MSPQTKLHVTARGITEKLRKQSDQLVRQTRPELDPQSEAFDQVFNAELQKRAGYVADLSSIHALSHSVVTGDGSSRMQTSILGEEARKANETLSKPVNEISSIKSTLPQDGMAGKTQAPTQVPRTQIQSGCSCKVSSS